METEKIVINATSNDGKPVEVILREGQAPQVFELNPFNIINAHIDAIIQFVTTNKFLARDENSVVITYCKNINSNPRIKFESNPGHEINNVIVSPILKFKDLENFGINNDVRFNQQNLIKLIRKSAHLFKSVAQCDELIKKLQSFEIKFESNLKIEDNRRGATTQEANKALKFTKGELPEFITLHSPLFEGDESTDIDLTIEIDADNGTPMYSFYSITYQTKMMQRLNEIIDERIDKLNDKFTCVEVLM